MIINTEIPAGIDTSFLRETISNSEPSIRREGRLIIIPVFIRTETVEEIIVSDDDTVAGTKDVTKYRYYEVPVEYVGQDLEDYGQCLLQSYAAIRKYFYGDWAVQNEMLLKGTFARHQFAVKTAFPKESGEVIPAVERFNAIKESFWGLVDRACAAVGKSRSDLPERFSSEEMFAWAAENGMEAADIANYTAKFSIVSLNLLQNGRNWDELFNAD